MANDKKTTPVALLTNNHHTFILNIMRFFESKPDDPVYVFIPANETKETTAEKLGHNLFAGKKNIRFWLIGSRAFTPFFIKTALDILFSDYDRAIIFEEGTDPDESFIGFAEKGLEYYKDNQTIFSIEYPHKKFKADLFKTYNYEAYFFSRPSSGPWATWKDRWEKFDSNLDSLYRKALIKGTDLNHCGNDVAGLVKERLLEPEPQDYYANRLLSVYLNNAACLYPVPGFEMNDRYPLKKKDYRFPSSNESETSFDSKLAEAFNVHSDIFYKEYSVNSPYKVLHICMMNSGGAGVAAKRLHEGLLANGVDSEMLVLQKNNDTNRIKIIPETYPDELFHAASAPEYISGIWESQWHCWQNTLEQYPKYNRGLDLFSDERSDIPLEDIRQVQEADILNFHWTAGMVDIPSFFKNIANKRIVWTLHDMAPFTGGCHYSMECTKYRRECGSCPQLGSSSENDLSRLVWQAKKEGYPDGNITVVTPSRWLGSCAKESSLFGNYAVHTIAYGYALDLFQAHPKPEMKKKYDIPQGKKVILFLADSMQKERKGKEYFEEMLRIAGDKEREEWVIGVFGELFDKRKSVHGFEIHSFGKLTSVESLSEVYSCADVYVLPTLADNLPNTLIESLVCGTPCAAFNLGGVGDIVDHKKNGYLAKAKDAADLLAGIQWILNESNYESLRKNGLEKAASQFELKAQAHKYEMLYQDLLKEIRPSAPLVNESNNIDRPKLILRKESTGDHSDYCSIELENPGSLTNADLQEEEENLNNIMKESSGTPYLQALGDAAYKRNDFRFALLWYWTIFGTGTQESKYFLQFAKAAGELHDSKMFYGSLNQSALSGSFNSDIRSLYKKILDSAHTGKPSGKIEADYTIFSITGPFTGKSAEIQKAAIASWKKLPGSPAIVLIGGAEGTANAAVELDVKHLPGNPVNADELLAVMKNESATNYIAYFNAHTVPTEEFSYAFEAARRNITYFLMLGQRWDISFDSEIFDTDTTIKELLAKSAAEDGILQNASMIGYTLFHKDIFTSIPNFDLSNELWMNAITRAALSNAFHIVNISDAAPVYFLTDGKPGFLSQDELEPHLKKTEELTEQWGHSEIRSVASNLTATYRLQNNKLRIEKKPAIIDELHFFYRLKEAGWLERANAYLYNINPLCYVIEKVDSPVMSVIITASGLQPHLTLLLWVLKRVRRPIEIILVNNGVRDGAFMFHRNVTSTYIQLLSPTSSATARNIGAVMANAPLLLFLDDTTVPDSNAIDAYIAAFSKYDIIAARGRLQPKNDLKFNKSIPHFDPGDKPFPVFASIDTNIAYRKDAFFKAGGFFEQFDTANTGFELSIRLEQHCGDKRKLIYLPEALAFDNVAANDAGFGNIIKQKQLTEEYLKRKYTNLDEYIASWDGFIGKPELLMPANESTLNNLLRNEALLTERIEKQVNKNVILPAPAVDDLPVISIVTANYNNADTLEDTILSVISQNYPKLQYVIIDGGSTDGSIELIKKYEKYLHYWVSEPDDGLYDAINKGFANTDGEIMGWINADDKYHPHAFFKAAAVFQSDNAIEWITGRGHLWNGKGELTFIDPVLHSFNEHSFYLFIHHHSYLEQENTLWKRSLWERAGGKLETEYKLAADTELWVRFFRYAQLFCVNTLFGGFRVREGQKSRLEAADYKNESAIVLEQHKDGLSQSIQLPPNIINPHYNKLAAAEGILKTNDISAVPCWELYVRDLQFVYSTTDDASIRDMIENELLLAGADLPQPEEIQSSKQIHIANDKADESHPIKQKRNLPSLSVGILVTEDNSGFESTLQSIGTLSYQPADIIIIDASKSGVPIPEDARIIYKRSDHHITPPVLANMAVDRCTANYICIVKAGEIFKDNGFRSFTKNASLGKLPDFFFGMRSKYNVAPSKNETIRYATRYDKGITNPLADFIANKGLSLLGALIKTDIIRNAGKFTKQFIYGWDYEFVFRIAETASFTSTIHELSRIVQYREQTPLAQLNENSFYALLKRELLASRPLSVIFPTLQTENDDDFNTAITMITKGFLDTKDYYAAAELLGSVHPKRLSLENIYQLMNSCIGSGNISLTADYLQKAIDIRPELKNELMHLRQTTDNLHFIEQQLEKGTAEKNPNALAEIIQTIVEAFGYSFLPAYYSGIVSLLTNKPQEAFSHLFSAALFNPESADAMKMLKALRAEEHIETIIEKIVERLRTKVTLFVE